MLYRLNTPSTWLLPLILLIILLCSLPSLSIFNATTRWVVLGLGLLWIAKQRKFFLFFKTPFGLMAQLLLLWPFLTVFWSDVPDLSLVKAIGFFITTCTLFSLGLLWVASRRPKYQIMDVFYPFLVAFFVLIIVKGVPSGIATGYNDIYVGSGNPNATGIAGAICLPLVLWKMFNSQPTRKWLWKGALVFLIYMMLATLSRTSILVASIVILGLILGMGAGRAIRLSVYGLIALCLSFIVFPPLPITIGNYLYTSLIMKGATNNPNLTNSVFTSRAEPLKEQWRAAQAGGIFGGGYGSQIEVGHYVIINDYPIEISPGSYTREKGNSILAVMEEQGLVGVFITIFWGIIFFLTLFRQFNVIRDRDGKILMGMFIFFLAGMLIGSMFEAWWVSPGSLESFVFWTMAGMAYAFGESYKRNIISETH